MILDQFVHYFVRKTHANLLGLGLLAELLTLFIAQFFGMISIQPCQTGRQARVARVDLQGLDQQFTRISIIVSQGDVFIGGQPIGSQGRDFPCRCALGFLIKKLTGFFDGFPITTKRKLQLDETVAQFVDIRTIRNIDRLLLEFHTSA